MIDAQGFIVLIVLLSFFTFILFASETAVEVVLLRKKGWIDRKRALWLPVGANGLAAVITVVFSVVVVPILLVAMSLSIGYLIWSSQRGETDWVTILGGGAIGSLIWFGIPLVLIALIRFVAFGFFKGKESALTWKYNIIPIVILEIAYIVSQVATAVVVIAMSPMFLPPF